MPDLMNSMRALEMITSHCKRNIQKPKILDRYEVGVV